MVKVAGVPDGGEAKEKPEGRPGGPERLKRKAQENLELFAVLRRCGDPGLLGPLGP